MINDFIHKNLLWILITLAGAGWTLFQYVQDERHSMRGEAETKLMRYEVRKLEAYEMSDPDSKYSPARKMLIKEIQDDLKDLEED